MHCDDKSKVFISEQNITLQVIKDLQGSKVYTQFKGKEGYSQNLHELDQYTSKSGRF